MGRVGAGHQIQGTAACTLLCPVNTTSSIDSVLRKRMCTWQALLHATSPETCCDALNAAAADCQPMWLNDVPPTHSSCVRLIFEARGRYVPLQNTHCFSLEARAQLHSYSLCKLGVYLHNEKLW